MTATSFIKWIPATLLVLSGQLPPAYAQTTTGTAATSRMGMSEKLHANALASFQQGRFSEAYGRLINLADAGHVPSAELALWMYLHGTSVFGRDWDSTPEQLKAWAQTSGQPVQAMRPHVYPRALTAVSERKR